ncbi:MAG: phage holin family protein [Faecalicoccus sp.]|uniref:phage holin family protein n=1 Tax=Faecalicoccus sp. TaxID=1971758 RepID=UPI002A841DC2|nr:phage holin family protein [Faecalicoccus sp.]MDY4277595.1 phage holin family protein [Faecalicoccus sp.]
MNNLINLFKDYHGMLFCILFVLNFLDCFTGWCKARLLKKENSKMGIKGIMNKLANWIILLIAFLLSYSFVKLGEIISINVGFALLLGWFVLISLIINETRSILENLVELGVKVPLVLTKGLEVYEKKIEEIELDESKGAEK